jgi:hypothetical protein
MMTHIRRLRTVLTAWPCQMCGGGGWNGTAGRKCGVCGGTGTVSTPGK